MKVVVIGEGFGARAMAPAYRRLGFAVEIVASRDAAAIARACATEVDLVSVHSPPFLHREHVATALAHGRAVLCDKPFGLDATQARDMRDRAREAGVLHFLNFEFRLQPSRLKLAELLHDGAIGRLRHISWTLIGSGARLQPHRWLFDADLGGGWIGAYGSHAIDTLRWLASSEIAECGGIARTETPSRPDRDGVAHPSTAEDAYSAWFVLANGCTVSMDTAFSAAVTLPHRLVLMGAEGALELVDEHTIVLRRPGEADRTIEMTPGPDEPRDPALVAWLAEVRDALRDRRQIAPSFEDGLAVAEAMDRLRRSVTRLHPA